MTAQHRTVLAAAALLLFSVCAGGAARAATCTSIANGNWNAKTTWGTAANGCVGATGGIPGAADTVNIANLNHTVTVSDNRSASSVTFTAGNAFPSLTISSGVTLSVTNTVTVNGANGNSGTRRVTVGINAVLNVGGDLVMNGGSNNSRFTELLIDDGPSTAVNVAGDFGSTAAGGNFNSATRMLVTFNGSGTLSIGGNFGGTATLTSGNGTIAFNGSGNQSIGAYNSATSNFNNVTISKSSGTATFAGNVLIRGDLTDNGNFDPASGNRTVTFGGSATQNLLGTAASTDFYRVTLTNGGNLALAHDLSVSNLLTLTSGSIVTGTNKVFISNGSNISSAGGSDFVDGNLQKAYSTGSNVSRIFEVGTTAGGNNYAPVTVVFAAVSTGGNVTVSTVGSEHPDIAASDINSTLSINRYWTISNSGVAFTTYGATFTFINPGDLDSGVDPLFVIAQRRTPPSPAAGSWSDTTVGTRTATTHQITGETGFGDFAIGTRVGTTPGIGRFNAFDTGTPAGQITGVIQTKVAGVAFNVDLVHLNAAGTALQNFGNPVVVDLLDASDDSGAFDADACRPTWPVIQTLSPNPAFPGNRITVSFTESNSRPIARIRVSNVAGTQVGCSTDAFAIRPSALASLSVSHADWENPGAITVGNTAFTAGGEIHKAGRNFRIVASAVNGAGSPAVTTNYTGSPTSMLTACAGAACTSAFGTLTLGAAFAAGQLASNAATYGEVGSFNLQLVDSTFADIDSGDGTPADCSASGRYVCSSTVAVGRFVPDHFAVSVTTTPAFGTGCGAGNFTYVGQSFGYTLQPVATVTAQDFGNNSTTLYAGSWWRITNSTLTPGSQAARYSAAVGTLDLSGLPAIAGDPVIVPGSPTAGQGTLTFSSGTGLSFTRISPIAPASPYNADIGLAVNVVDADGVAYAGNPVNVGLPSAGGGIGFNNGKQMRFGRLFVTNARGSSLVPLSMTMELQYWNSTAFVTNTADSCTTVSANNVEMKNFTQTLDLCDTSLTVSAFAKGRATGQLSKPGSANVGSVTLVPRLGSVVSGAQTCIAGSPTAVTGANVPYLRGQWDAIDQGADGQVFDDNPAGRGTFGIYPGSGTVIDLRENF